MKILVGKNGVNYRYSENKRCKIFNHPNNSGDIILEFIRPLSESEKEKTIDEMPPSCLRGIFGKKFLTTNTFYSREAIEALGIAITEYLKHN
jgi:hypothetical protein